MIYYDTPLKFYLKCTSILQLYYKGYNNKFGKDGMHQPLLWNDNKVCSVIYNPTSFNAGVKYELISSILLCL